MNGAPNIDQIAQIIDPAAMALSSKLGRSDVVLTEEMQERIRAARHKAETILAGWGSANVTDKIDLESEICDVADMANICVMLMDEWERNEYSVTEKQITAKQAAAYLSYWREAASFAVLH